MAIVTIKKEKAKELLGNLADRDIDNQLSMFGAAVENIGNETIDLEIPPNRPDMLSAQGFFRALSTYLGKKPKQYEVNKPLKDYEVKIDSSVKDIRPFTACAIVKNLKFDDDRIKEMIDIQEKLHLYYSEFLFLLSLTRYLIAVPWCLMSFVFLRYLFEES